MAQNGLIWASGTGWKTFHADDADESESAGDMTMKLIEQELTGQIQKIGFYRIDMLVEDKSIVELKSSERLAEADERQLYNYLRAANLQVGLLLHFGPNPTFKRIAWTGKRLVA